MITNAQIMKKLIANRDRLRSILPPELYVLRSAQARPYLRSIMPQVGCDPLEAAARLAAGIPEEQAGFTMMLLAVAVDMVETAELS